MMIPTNGAPLDPAAAPSPGLPARPWPRGDWRRELREAVSEPAELLRALELDPSLLPSVEVGAESFPLRVPRPFLSRMRKGDPDDPLLRQVLPLGVELDRVPGFGIDPVGERSLSPASGLLQKYEGRVLLVATGVCGVHCRYCFRRHFPYGDHRPSGPRLHEALCLVEKDRSISEVILSGGDPLTLPDSLLASLVERIGSLGHVRRLRLHTRLPVVLPSRVDEGLVEALASSRLPTVLVIHANHPREVDDDLRRSLLVLRRAGLTLLNQAVLLRRVNDSVGVQAELAETLFETGVLPYYLHLLDPVQGAAHFDVDERRAADLVAGLRRRLPGYLVPRLVREVEGAPAKVPVG